MKVEKSNKMTGFTLVEMLVVIAIIAILASALFPAIQNAMGQAQATAMKNKGRGIWVAVNSANMEREPLNLGPVWPKNLLKKEGQDAADDGEKTIKESSTEYFAYLMSDGDKVTEIAAAAEDRVVSDLSPSSLIASGITPAGKSVTENNIAWRVCEIDDNSAAEYPFLFSKNLDKSVTELEGAKASETSKRLELDKDTDPFGDKRAVWVTRGGGVFDARRKYLTYHQVMGDKPEGKGDKDDENNGKVKVWTVK